MFSPSALQARGIAVLLVAGFVATANRSVDGNVPASVSSCSAIAEWAENTATFRMAELHDLARLPVRWRRAVVSRLPVEKQQALWPAHLEILSANAREGSLESRAIATVRSRLPELFDPTIELSRRLNVARNLWLHALPALGKEKAGAIFVTLGSGHVLLTGSDDGAAAHSALGDGILGSNPFTPRFASSRGELAACVCNTFYQDCYSAPECTESSNPHCEHTEQGCGPMWLAPCDGNCDS